VFEHREEFVSGFSKEYGVKRLVWYEVHADIMQAITREKQIKKWNRDWKVNLIQKSNPDWRDLYDEIVGQEANLDSRLRGKSFPAVPGMTVF